MPARAGSTILTLLVRPAAGPVVQALAKRPLRLGELVAELDGPSAGTLRARLDDLVALGAVAKKGGGMPYAVWNELNALGRDLLRVVDTVDAWLAQAPQGPIPLGGVAAKRALRALVGAWDSTMLQLLATGPRSLVALNREIAELNYPALERRFATLRSTEIVEAAPSGVGHPVAISRWGREGAGPLLAAARFEGDHMAKKTAPLTPAEEETLSRLAVGP